MPIDITLKTIAKARLDARTARVNITDSRGRGLVLRGGPEGLVWGHRVQLGGKPCRLVLGTVDRWSVAEARDIANAASDYAKSHKVAPDDAWLQAHLVGAGKIAAPSPDQNLAAAKFPTFIEGRDEYLNDIKDYIAFKSWDDYRQKLEHPKLVAALGHMRLPTITQDDVMAVVREVHVKHERTAEMILAAIRPMWTYLEEYGRRKRYGVEQGVMAGLKKPGRKIPKQSDDDEDDDDDQPWTAGYVPEISELARIIATARSGIMHPVAGAAVELTAWTVQRRLSVVKARRFDFKFLSDELGGLWVVRHRKGGKKKRPHVIPLPPAIWACVVRADAAAEARRPGTRWMFPAARPRRKGDPVNNMNESSLTHLFAKIPDCGASPHDTRRTMGTHGEKLLGFSRVDTGTLMDHQESINQSERITSRTKGTETHNVTGAHYSLHDGTHHTWPIMRIWADAIEKAIDEETEKLDMRRLALGYGDPAYRIGGPPAEMMMWTGGVLEGDELTEFNRRQKLINSRVETLGAGLVVDEDEEA